MGLQNKKKNQSYFGEIKDRVNWLGVNYIVGVVVRQKEKKKN